MTGWLVPAFALVAATALMAWQPVALSRASHDGWRTQTARVRWWLLRRVRRRSEVADNHRRAAELLLSLADELRAGLPPETALARASAQHRICPRAAAACHVGGDVAMALRSDAEAMGVDALYDLATVWSLACDSGAGMAAAAQRLSAATSAGEAMRRQLAAELAGPRATAKVLAVLPLVGLLLGTAIGSDPIGFLLGSPVGWLFLAGGIVLDLCGLWWINHMVAAVERRL